MDKNAIKKYAVWARRELLSRVAQKALQYGVDGTTPADPDAEIINGRLLSAAEKSQRRALIDAIAADGYEQILEEAAYTWFNRFIALRFMEVNNYLPSHTRVFTDENNAFAPQILAEAIRIELPGLDRDLVYKYKEANDDDALYKYLLITQCNALKEILPGMFSEISGYTELLFPDNLLREGSAVEQMIAMITEDDWRDEVQIIGWLYQYYISEKHEEVVNPLQKKPVATEDVPAATQLFTPDWVVRYMVDNSLGRYWVERNQQSELTKKLEFLAMPKDGKIQYIDKSVEPTAISFFDPCMGSGHILCYAFDIFMEIYRECGYTDREAVQLIIQNNLFGVDVDERAAQLAYFSVMMKARQYDRRFFSRAVAAQVYCPHKDKEGMLKGSMMQVLALPEKPDSTDENTLYADEYYGENGRWNFKRLLNRKYTIVCTNPPYLNKYNAELKKFVNENYKDYSSDLFSVFMYRNLLYCEEDGYCGYMTPNVWMFIKSYENLRKFIIENKDIVTLVQMAKGAFFKEATVDICAFILSNAKDKSKGEFIRLENFKGDMETQRQKTLNAINDHNCGYYYERCVKSFSKIPGSPIAYWISEAFAKPYEGNKVSDYGFARSGLQTGDNDAFLRYWDEVQFDTIAFGMKNKTQYIESKKKWVPQIKGGNYRKWYGNFDYIVNWENDGKEIRECSSSRMNAMANDELFFKQGITWSHTTSGVFGARFLPNGYMFNVEAPTLFVEKASTYYFLAMLNSCVSQKYLNAINATMHYLVGNISALPAILETRKVEVVEELVKECVLESKCDWDSFETSWDFKRHPLI